MKIQLQLIFYLLLSIGVMGQSTELVEQPNNDEWTTLKTEAFEINHPEDWEVNETGLAGTTFILLSEVTSPTDLFRDNVNLILQDVKGYNLDLEKYIEISLQQLPSMVQGSKVLLNETIDSEDGSFQKLIYTGKQGEYDLKFEQFVWFLNDKVYVLTLTCEVDTFDQYQALGEKIMGSFTIVE